MAQSEIDAVRALLRSKPRPVGWPARRKRLDEVGTIWPVADDVELTAVGEHLRPLHTDDQEPVHESVAQFYPAELRPQLLSGDMGDN